MRPETELWWVQARRDLRTARNSHRSRDFYAAVFFCQQAVEKSLKATVIESLRRLPPRTHNLAELGTLLGVPRGIATFLMELTPEYITTRYPDAAGGPIADLYDGHISRRILDRTSEVMAWARRQLR